MEHERRQIREEVTLGVHGTADRPTLIYLPGLHGDWTLIGGLRLALGGRVRFVEVTYPRTLTWTLDDYAAAIESALKSRGIKHGWLLGESFGSQIVWPLVTRAQFEIDGVVLAGGFVRHPTPRTAGIVGLVAEVIPFPLLRSTLKPYARVMKWRYRRSPAVLKNIDQFIVRRTDLDRKAAAQRLRLLSKNDPSPAARAARPPLFALTGLWDPIVPWFPVRRWLRSQCPSLRDHRIIWRADHNVLATAPKEAAQIITEWMAITVAGKRD